MKCLLYCLLGVALAAAGTCRASDAKDQATLTGILHTGIVSIGGETTGTALSFKSSTGQAEKIEVQIDASTVGASLAKDGAAVTITGEIVVHSYIERGNVPRLVAARITSATGK